MKWPMAWFWWWGLLRWWHLINPCFITLDVLSLPVQPFLFPSFRRIISRLHGTHFFKCTDGGMPGQVRQGCPKSCVFLLFCLLGFKVPLCGNIGRRPLMCWPLHLLTWFLSPACLSFFAAVVLQRNHSTMTGSPTLSLWLRGHFWD